MPYFSKNKVFILFIFNYLTHKIMSDKTQKIIYWILTGLVAFVFIGSAIGKFTANAEGLEKAAVWGISASSYTLIAAVELLSVILFIIPRTGILGTLLLAAYMGGAIATHVEHDVPIIAPCVVQAFVWIVAAYRFPELRERILGK
jgi:DoxX-like family